MASTTSPVLTTQAVKQTYLTYVGMPYSHESSEVVDARMKIFNNCIAQLIGRGIQPVSPLLFHESVKSNPNLGKDWGFWEHYGRRLMTPVTRALFICIDGWTSSEGVRAEIKLAKYRGLQIGFVELNKDGILQDIFWQY